MLRIFGPRCSLEPIDAGKAKSIPKRALWIDLLDPSDEEEKLVEKLIGQDIPTRDELLEIEPSSRLYERQGTLFMTASVLHGFTDEDPDSDPIGFILSKDHLVTVRYVDPKPFVVFAENLYAEPDMAQSALGVLVRLLDAIVDRMADELEAVQRDMEATSSRIFQRKARRGGRKVEMRLEILLLRLGAIQRSLAEIRESGVGTSRLLSFLVGTKQVGDSDHETHIESLSGDIKALLDHANFLSDNIVFLLDASLGLINLEQNDVMRLFSVFAVVLMPPTLVAGVYGMNFRYMPELQWVDGYPFALTLIVISAILPYLLAKRSGWL